MALSLGQDLSVENNAMKFSIAPLAFILIMVFSWSVRAEVYESKDAQGNPVFSDVPTAGAETVDLPTENIADAVKASPETEAKEIPGT